MSGLNAYLKQVAWVLAAKAAVLTSHQGTNVGPDAILHVDPIARIPAMATQRARLKSFM